MKKKSILLLVAVLIIGMMTAACGNGGGEESESAGTDARVVRLVTCGTDEPYSLVSEDGTWTGMDADLWAEIGNRTGWDIQMHNVGFDAMLGELDADRADVASNCLGITEERQEKYLASVPYYGDTQSIAVIKDSELKTFADLKGKKVGTQNGWASQPALEALAEEYGFEVVIYEEVQMGYQDILLGRLDAMGCSASTIAEYEKNNGDKFDLMEEKITPVTIGCYFPKTEDGEALKAEVDKVIQEMIDDGTLGKITEKWFYTDMTQYIN